MTLKLREYQNEAVDATFAGWTIQGLVRLAVEVGVGGGKCHQKGQGILMYDGSIKKIEDVVIGDQVMGMDSTPRTVSYLARGSAPMLRVNPVKGDSWVVNDEHILTLYRSARSSSPRFPCEQAGVVDVGMQEYLEWSRKKKANHKLIRVGVDFPLVAEPKLDPYILGIILGDGSLSQPYTCGITTTDPEVLGEIEEFAKVWGLSLRSDKITYYFTQGRTGGKSPLNEELRRLGILPITGDRRFIPQEYKVGSRNTRLQILAGLLDSDGYLHHNFFEFASKSKQLAEDVAFIARSLGMAAYIKVRLSGVAKGQFRVNISGDVDVLPTRIPRKQARPRTQKKNVLHDGFTVEHTGQVEDYYGIMVDGDHRYLLDDFTVTHNTLIAAEVIRRTLAANPKAKIVTLAHRRELLKSMQRTVQNHCGVSVGMVDGQVHPAMRKRNLEAQIVCINTATLGVSKKQRGDVGSRVAVVAELHRMLGNVDLVILDECHRANTDTALDCLNELGCFNGTRLLGLTGTLFRQDNKMLTDVFEDCVYRKDMLALIEEGWLVEPKMKKALISGLDLNKVAVSRSMGVTDFNATDLDKIMEASGDAAVIAEFAKRYCSDRQTLVFCPTVKAAERVTEALKAANLRAATVHGDMPSKDREAILDSFELGGPKDIQFISNCMIITEGTDIPLCSAIIMARPTRSKQLYIQILGRALRLHDEKNDALVIDLVGATAVNGLMGCADLFGAKDGESILEAKKRQEHIATVVKTKAQLVFNQLTPEEQEEVALETIVSGSFNLFDVELDDLVEQARKVASEAKEKKERVRMKALPDFEPPGRCGSLLELDFEFLLSLESWATLPQYKGSYAVGLCHKDKWYAFYCDKSQSDHDKKYGFICMDQPNFEAMEQAIINFTKHFPGTAGAAFYAQNKLQENHPKRKKKASAEQIAFMGDLMRRAKIKQDEWSEMKNGDRKQPNIGCVVDWIDYLTCCKDARKQIESVKEWLKNEPQ